MRTDRRVVTLIAYGVVRRKPNARDDSLPRGAVLPANSNRQKYNPLFFAFERGTGPSYNTFQGSERFI